MGGLRAAGGAAGLVERLSCAVHPLVGGRGAALPQRGHGGGWGHASPRRVERRPLWRQMGAPPGGGRGGRLRPLAFSGAF